MIMRDRISKKIVITKQKKKVIHKNQFFFPFIFLNLLVKKEIYLEYSVTVGVLGAYFHLGI